MTIEERTLIAQGWALLAQGLLDDAQARAAKALESSPKNVSALVLAIEVALARSGAQAGLAQYEQWLGQRMEEPAVIRRIAIALLKESAAQSTDAVAKLEALRALAGDGDRAAEAELASAATSGGAPERRALASIGDEGAIKSLASDLKKGVGNALTTIDALSASGSKSAIQPLIDSLQNPSPEIRGTGVEGLGKLARTLNAFELVPRIKPLLEDRSSFVQAKAAGALYGLNDMAGLQILQELLQSDASSSRLVALQAMASRPDAAWLEQVQRLSSASEPEVRIAAAQMLATHDPDMARKVLEGLQNDPNPAFRDLASDALGSVEATDLPTLRRQLKSSNRLLGVRSAARLLVLLR